MLWGKEDIDASEGRRDAAVSGQRKSLNPKKDATVSGMSMNLIDGEMHT